ncbi:MAG: hypothetical protein RQ885_08860 [Desulfurococcales archaeon]|jgi:hypothetical protein|nr:hypothetical protein [Desulfurococcales archaeon]
MVWIFRPSREASKPDDYWSRANNPHQRGEARDPSIDKMIYYRNESKRLYYLLMALNKAGQDMFTSGSLLF